MASSKLPMSNQVAVPQQYATRPRLLAQLQRSLRPVLWLTAPLGSGKTTVARSFAEASGHLVIWHRFTKETLTTEDFLHQITETFRDCYAGSDLAEIIISDAKNTQEHSRNLFTRIARAHKARWVMCLDDYHLLDEGNALHGILAELGNSAENLQLTLMITSRTPPTPQWSLNVANRQIDLLADFNFDIEELSHVVSAYPELSGNKETWLQEVLEKTDGWPAGVTLLFERLRLNLDEGLAIDAVLRHAISDYVDYELFGALANEVQTLLLQSSALPFVPIEFANEIFRNPGAKQTFEKLCHERLFTQRTTRTFEGAGDNIAPYLIFKHQNAFLIFLRYRASIDLSAENQQEIAIRGAEVLARNNEFAAAAELYATYNCWDQVSALILSNALHLIQSGRLIQLQAVFSTLPVEVMGENPDLLFWRGACETSMGLKSAREHLSKAYILYHRQGNAIGMAIAWRAVVDAIWLSWDGLDQLSDWIDEYDARASIEFAELPGPFRVGLTMSRLGILSFWSPEHPELPQLEGRVAEYVHAPMPTQERALLFVKMLYHFSYGTGNRSQTDFYLNIMRSLVQQDDASPLDHILLSNFEAAYQYCFVGTPEKCYEHVESALRMAEDSGVTVWQSVSLTHGLYMSLGQGDITRANKYFSQFKQVIGLNNAMHVAFDEFFSAWLAMLEGRTSSAMNHATTGLKLIEHNPPPMIRNLFLGAKASLLIQQRDWHQAWSVLTEIRRAAVAARSNTFEILTRLLQAIWCLQRKRHWAARAFLSRARDIGVVQNMFVCPWLPLDELPKLIGFALESDIDQEYFSRWVSLYSLKIPAGFAARDRWPWPIKIRTLGTFEIELSGKIAGNAGKAQKKLLEILGTLITAGPRGATQSELIHNLWPEKNEEKGRSNLNTSLARLRSYMGNPDVVISSGGRVFLNPELCLVDSWELLAAPNPNGASDTHQLAYLENLYRGDYTVPDSATGAEMTLEKTLVNRYTRIAQSLARALEKQEDFDKALFIHRQILEKAGVEEAVYRNIMHCYARLNRPQQIALAYNECEQVIATQYGTALTPETVSLYESLLLKTKSTPTTL